MGEPLVNNSSTTSYAIAKSRDCEVLHELSRDAGLRSWKADDFRKAIAGGDEIWTARVEDEIAGYTHTRLITDEGQIKETSDVANIREYELLNLVVRHDLRRKGIAKGLYKRFRESRPDHVENVVFLEVRSQNEGAVALYLSLEFEIIGKRNNYYNRPSDDAFLMEHRFRNSICY